MKPNDFRSYFRRGNAYSNEGEYDRAISDYNEAIKLKPDYALAYLNLGITCAKKQGFEEARNNIETAYKIESVSEFQEVYENAESSLLGSEVKTEYKERRNKGAKRLLKYALVGLAVFALGSAFFDVTWETAGFGIAITISLSLSDIAGFINWLRGVYLRRNSARKNLQQHKILDDKEVSSAREERAQDISAQNIQSVIQNAQNVNIKIINNYYDRPPPAPEDKEKGPEGEEKES